MSSELIWHAEWMTVVNWKVATEYTRALKGVNVNQKFPKCVSVSPRRFKAHSIPAWLPAATRHTCAFTKSYSRSSLSKQEHWCWITGWVALSLLGSSPAVAATLIRKFGACLVQVRQVKFCDVVSSSLWVLFFLFLWSIICFIPIMLGEALQSGCSVHGAFKNPV